jgi:hypothetical protein
VHIYYIVVLASAIVFFFFLFWLRNFYPGLSLKLIGMLVAWALTISILLPGILSFIPPAATFLIVLPLILWGGHYIYKIVAEPGTGDDPGAELEMNGAEAEDEDTDYDDLPELNEEFIEAALEFAMEEAKLEEEVAKEAEKPVEVDGAAAEEITEKAAAKKAAEEEAAAKKAAEEEAAAKKQQKQG